MSNHEHDPGRVDWLDLGPDPDEGRTPANPRRRYLWYGAAAALVVLALVLTQTQHGTNRAATSPRSASATGTPSRTVSSSAASSGSFVGSPPVAVTTLSNGLPAGSPTVAPQLGPPKVTNLGHPLLLDVPADWELFARGPGVVVRIQLALGRVTTTPVPVSGHDAPVAFLVGSDRVLLRSLDDTTGYVVRDGKRAAELPPALRRGVWMLPGPHQGQLWADPPPGGDYAVVLLRLDGSPTGVKIANPNSAGVLGSDGAGYLLMAAIGGVYDVRPGSVDRITTGIVLAGGPTRWLAVECDDHLSCTNVVIDRTGGARHTLDTPVDSFETNSGTISPDGKTAAMLRHDDISSSGIHLVDLDSGADRPVKVTQTTTGTSIGPQLVWSPDSRWLFATDAAGRVMVISRATGRATPLRAQLPPVDQLASRDGAG